MMKLAPVEGSDAAVRVEPLAAARVTVILRLVLSSAETANSAGSSLQLMRVPTRTLAKSAAETVSWLLEIAVALIPRPCS